MTDIPALSELREGMMIEIGMRQFVRDYRRSAARDAA